MDQTLAPIPPRTVGRRTVSRRAAAPGRAGASGPVAAGVADRRRRRSVPPALLVLAGATLVLAAVASVLPAGSGALAALALGVAAGPALRRVGVADDVVRLGGVGLRIGVALLGLRIAVDQLVALGPQLLVMGVGCAAATAAVTLAAARALRVPPGVALLVAAGSAICGASAIAAVDQVAGTRRDEMTYAAATVTGLGAIAMVLLPWLASGPLALEPATAGAWAGGALQEVAQVTGAAGALPAGALAAAVVVKLVRVSMLAPAVLGVALWRRRTADAPVEGRRPPLVPRFLLGFVAAAAIGASGLLPAAAIDAGTWASSTLLLVGLLAVGTQIRPAVLRVAGLRPALLGVVGATTATTTALALALLVG